MIGWYVDADDRMPSQQWGGKQQGLTFAAVLKELYEIVCKNEWQTKEKRSDKLALRG